VQAYELAEPGLAEAGERLAGEPGIQLHRGAMERDAYYSVLAASDLTLLPYDPVRYRTRGSMVYSEASVMGTPVIVPGDTWLERDVIEHGNGVAIASFTPEAVAQAIADALPQVKTLRANAQRYAEQLRPHRGIGAYVDCVLRLGGGAPQTASPKVSVTTSGPATKFERIFIIQHGLSDLHAHYYGETLGWLAACRDRGISPRFYIKRGALPQIVLKLAAKPVFPYAPDEFIDPDPISWQLSDYMTLSTGFADACKTLETDGVGGNDLVMVPFASERCVLGAAQWLQRLSPAARPAMVFNFLVPDLNWRVEDDRSRVSGEFSYFRYAARRIRELLPPSKLFFTSPVYGLCTALSEAAQYRCREVPLGTSFPSEQNLAMRDRHMPPRAHIGVLGEFRPERGSEIVGEVLLRFAALRPGKSIAVHVMNEGQATALRKAAHERGVRSPLFLYHGHADHGLFLRRLLSTDILLLPYNWQRYAIRPSNVFSEAAGYGVVAVVPDRTWAADKLLEGHGAGTIFRDFSVDSMIEALVTASEQYRELKQLALAKQLAWRQAHSTHALLDNILAKLVV
jgi:glycosyltransferase involved in cell wall biosynthesis